MTELGEQLSIRTAVPSDIPFIYDCIIQGVLFGTHFGSLLKASFFRKHFIPYLDKVLSANNPLIACMTDNPNTILGFLVHSPGHVHYCFTKEAFRKMGIMKELFMIAGLVKHTPIQYNFKVKYISEFLLNNPKFVHEPIKLTIDLIS